MTKAVKLVVPEKTPPTGGRRGRPRLTQAEPAGVNPAGTGAVAYTIKLSGDLSLALDREYHLRALEALDQGLEKPTLGSLFNEGMKEFVEKCANRRAAKRQGK